MRALDARPGPAEPPDAPFAVPVRDDASGQSRQHYPDVVVVQRGVTPIARSELQAILDGYVAHAPTRRAVYLVSDPVIARLVGQAVEACVDASRVAVQSVRTPSSAAPPAPDAQPRGYLHDQAELSSLSADQSV